MPRYFLEVCYHGAKYSGFQVQQNANTIQAEIERALHTFFRVPFVLTGSSRTDAGVHALQNYFHFDTDVDFADAKTVYHLNSILPCDIVIKRFVRVKEEAHCRFDALYRTYEYHIYQEKNPFIKNVAHFYPYPLDLDALNAAANILKDYTDFSSFSKRNTQVKTFNCRLYESYWKWENETLIYHVRGDRFLRGMVRGLTATMLRVGSGKILMDDFTSIIESRNCEKADFAVPAHGLFLVEVAYNNELFVHQE